MSHPQNEEISARRFQSFNPEPRYDAADFDCELPPNQKSELLGAPPKRPSILGPPQPTTPQPAASRRRVQLAVLITVIVVGAISTMLRHLDTEHAKTNSAPLAPQPALAPSPVPAATPHWQQASAPRAELIRLPPPRAQLVRLPEWKVNTERQLLMPSGVKVLGTLKGRLPSPDMLPATGNAIGDTWQVGENLLWIWLANPGAAKADWVDP
jgi:hypothetical protein